MKKDIKQYIRVGIDYYKETTIPMTGEDIKVLRKWNKQTIVDDFGKDVLTKIEKFDGFCFIPAHNDFQKIINGFYNKYEPISYQLNSEGNWDKIENLLRHIFNEQYDLGLDYLTILWKLPTQVLPIFCLVSEERNTGKTTFLNLLKSIFEGNMTLNTNEDFRSRFNSDWAGKLIVAIDEVLLDKKDDSERIKNLSTAKYYKAESKGKDKEEVEFFGKFILCSNNEENFVKIDSNEIRYWVRKVPTLGNSIDPNLLDELITEIPAFAYFLNTREIKAKKTTRMWFTKEQIHTEALDVLITGNRTSIEKELEEMLKDEFAVFEVNALCYTLNNIIAMLKNRGVNTSSGYVATILKDKYNMNYKNSSYKWYRSEIYSASSSMADGFTTEKGRYYTFERSEFAN
ncbi:primase-helicase family protein [uncultured Flavobacterium sp.]|uniref:primase-helicase family protein n=1 Tax=uncultured Flavobacterium sp. TaxID=165435 RepID=UPI0030EE4F52